MKNLTLASALAMSAAMSMFGSSSAMADVKVMAASACDGSVPAIRDNTRGRMTNPSLTVGGFVNCALLRDNAIAKMLQIQVAVIDNSSLLIGDGDISCKAIAVSRSGSAVSIGATVKTVGTNSAGVILTLPIPAVLFTDGNYIVNCSLPRRGAGDTSSSMSSVRYVEADPAP
jgi:hypothetical protein